MDVKQLKVGSYTGMGLALQMVCGSWCDFRGPERPTLFISHPSPTTGFPDRFTPLALSLSSVI